MQPLDSSSLIPHPSSLPLFDPAALLATCDGDAELLRKMCRHFQTFVPGRLAEVSEALQDRNTPRLREAAQKLGGMVSSFSAAAAEAAAQLGRLGSEGKIEEAIQTHSRLTVIVGRLISVLDTLSVEQLRQGERISSEPPAGAKRPLLPGGFPRPMGRHPGRGAGSGPAPRREPACHFSIGAPIRLPYSVQLPS